MILMRLLKLLKSRPPYKDLKATNALGTMAFLLTSLSMGGNLFVDSLHAISSKTWASEIVPQNQKDTKS